MFFSSNRRVFVPLPSCVLLHFFVFFPFVIVNPRVPNSPPSCSRSAQQLSTHSRLEIQRKPFSRDFLLSVASSPLSALDPALVQHIKSLGLSAKKTKKRCKKAGKRRTKHLAPATNPSSPNRTTFTAPATKDSDKLSFSFFNSQSVCKEGKSALISDFILEQNLDILFLTETWLRAEGDEPTISSLTPSGYQTLSVPRPSKGGGIAIIFKDSLSPLLSLSHTLPFPHPSFEFAQLSLSLPHNPVTLACIYRPPPSSKNKLTNSMFFSDFDTLLDHYSLLTGDLAIIGDFNFHYDQPNHPDTKRLCRSLSNHNLTQLVTHPTHQHGHILDWLVTHDNKLVEYIGTTSTLPSDHAAILATLNLSPPTPLLRPVTRRNVKSIDRLQFTQEATLMLSNTSPDILADHYNTSLHKLLDKHAPAKTRLLPPRPPSPWITDEIIQAKRKRRQTERLWRSTHLTIHRQMFNSARQEVCDLISETKTKHYQQQILSSQSPKELYTTVSSLLGTKKDSPLPTTHSTEDLPDLFSDFFINKINALRVSLDQAPCAPCPPDPQFSGLPLTSFLPVTESEVSNIIKTMSFKTCELDPLPHPLYSDCLPHLLPFMTDIINYSLKTGTVPDSFKTAIVRPLLKKHNLDPNDLKNYRPVSNLSFLSKLLEKVILDQLNRHLLAHNLLQPFQSAYRKHHSTETALLHILNNLLLNTDSGRISLLTLLDLSAAFDTIDHSILLQRLNYTFGIAETALAWFSSYLSNRLQTVHINGKQSAPIKLSCGVPQGSVLGPILFTLYTSPLSQIMQSHNLDHHFYADDTQLQDSDTPDKLQTLLTRTADCYLDIKNWMTNNKLKLNDSKTEAMLIGTRQKLSQLPTSLTLPLDTTSIELSTTVKNLGVIFDNTLSMQDFITHTTQSCYHHIRRISQIRKYLSIEATAKLVVSLILSRIDYCNSLLSNLPATTILPLQRVQNNAARLVLKKRKHDHITPLLQTLHWLPVTNRILYKTLTLCYKSINNSAPLYLSTSLQTHTTARPLRSSADNLLLHIPRTNLTLGSRAFSVAAPRSWNDLPLNLRSKSSVLSFKSSLKTHLFPKP